MWKPLKLAPWLMAVSIAWSLGFIYNVFYGGELSWLRRMYWQKIAMAEQVKENRRLIITGGSGAHYTVNSELIEQGLGIPVINLGLDGPIGLDVILPSVIDRVRQGDIVLLIPEYLLLLDEDGFGDRSGQFGVAIRRPGLGGLPAQQLIQDVFLLGIPTLRAVAKSSVDVLTTGKMTGYYSDPITERGDPTKDKERNVEWWELTIDRPISDHSVQRIEQFRQEVEARGGTLILSLPWIYGSTEEKTKTNIHLTAQVLQQIAPLIYDEESLNIKTDSSLFADTHYHLLPRGRDLRAQELVRQLKPLVHKTINPNG